MRLELQKAEVVEATKDAESLRPEAEIVSSDEEEDEQSSRRKKPRRKRKDQGPMDVTQAGFLIMGLQLEDMQ